MSVGAAQSKRTGRKLLGARKRVLALVVAFVTIGGLTAGLVGSGPAGARINGTQIGLNEFWIDACGMPTNGAFGNKSMAPGQVKVRSWRLPQNRRTVILLDGMRAQYDYSGWEINTNVQELVRHGVNVVEPIGGAASFYSNWNAPSNFNRQQRRYMWECVINDRLVPNLRQRGFGSKDGKFAIMGLSMGGNSALTLASKRRDLYHAAGSLSGYNFLSAPGMRTMLRIAMLDITPRPWNIDSMWGPPWSVRWFENDPFMRINRMQGLRVFLGSGNGLFGQHNNPNSAGAFVDDLFQGTPLEFLAFAQTKAFEAAAFVQGLPMMTYYSRGTHAWGYWQDMIWNAHSRGFFN